MCIFLQGRFEGGVQKVLCHVSLQWKKSNIWGHAAVLFLHIVLPTIRMCDKYDKYLSFHFNLGRGLWRDEVLAMNDNYTCEHRCKFGFHFGVSLQWGAGFSFHGVHHLH